MANDHKRNILVFQDKKKDPYGSSVSVMLYAPGWVCGRWASRQVVKGLLKAAGTVAIHLNKKVTHWSAMLPVTAVVCTPPSRSKRKLPARETHGTLLPNGTVEVDDD